MCGGGGWSAKIASFRGIEYLKGFEMYFDSYVNILYFIILGFNKHLGSLKNSCCYRGQLGKNTRIR